MRVGAAGRSKRQVVTVEHDSSIGPYHQKLSWHLCLWRVWLHLLIKWYLYFCYFILISVRVTCYRHYQPTHSLEVNPAEDLLLCYHIGSSRVSSDFILGLQSEIVHWTSGGSHSDIWVYTYSPCGENMKDLWSSVHIWKQLKTYRYQQPLTPWLRGPETPLAGGGFNNLRVKLSA